MNPRSPLIARIAAALGALTALALLVSGPGARFGLWDIRFAFALMQWAAFGGIAAVLLALAIWVFARRVPEARASALVALVLGGVAVGIPLKQLMAARSLPPIHDISTDTEHPPVFVAVLPLRKDAPNKLDYSAADSAALAAQQRKGYPDIQPWMLALPADEAQRRALTAARVQGWDMVADDTAAGRIEATATTRWFGFKDDVVIRVAAVDAGHSRIDMRSVSRLGGSDVGANARRIRDYFAALKAAR